MPHPDYPTTTCISSFPSEINQRIFASFSKLDCLRCMSVCRLWREYMTEWSIDQWRSIRLSNNDLDQIQPLLSLVGSYARHIVLVQPPEKSIIKVMDRLMHMGLTRLSTFMVAIDNKCDLMPSNTFSTFAQNMTRLHIGSTRSQCDILGILACCPQLTHFSSSARVHVSPKKTSSSSSSLSSPCSNLQFLRINHGISTDQLVDIMRASPNMRHLRLQWHSNIDLIQIVEARPELDIITCNVFPSLGQDPLWLEDYNTPCNHLRTFEIDNILHETPLHHIMAILNSSWGEGLERLSCDIGKLYQSKDKMRNMPPMLTPPDTCQLQEFIYDSHKSNMDDINDPEETIMLPIIHCCKQLQSIAIDMDASYEGRRFNEQILPELEPFNHLPHLRHLLIYEDREDLSDISFMLLQMRHFGVQLESFEYRMNTRNTSLEFVQALSMMPSMRRLVLQDTRSERFIRYDGFVTLAQALHQSSPIRSLTLRQCLELRSEKPFHRLADMTSIKHLTIEDTRWVNGCGLMHLADHHKGLDTLELVDVTVYKESSTPFVIEYLKARINHVVVHLEE